MTPSQKAGYYATQNVVAYCSSTLEECFLSSLDVIN